LDQVAIRPSWSLARVYRSVLSGVTGLGHHVGDVLLWFGLVVLLGSTLAAIVR